MAWIPRAVLWDLDGTLVDSENDHWLAWRETMLAEGAALSREQFAASFGRRNASFLPEWLGAATAPARVEQVAAAKEQRFRDIVHARGVVALPGALAWVERLRRAGWRQAIASSAPRLNIEAMLAAMGVQECFQAVVAAEEVHTGKPDPEVFLLAAGRLGVAPPECIVVEDSAAGVEGARRAGMRSIGVRRSGEPLPADLFVASLADLAPDAFDRLAGLNA